MRTDLRVSTVLGGQCAQGWRDSFDSREGGRGCTSRPYWLAIGWPSCAHGSVAVCQMRSGVQRSPSCVAPTFGCHDILVNQSCLLQLRRSSDGQGTAPPPAYALTRRPSGSVAPLIGGAGSGHLRTGGSGQLGMGGSGQLGEGQSQGAFTRASSGAHGISHHVASAWTLLEEHMEGLPVSQWPGWLHARVKVRGRLGLFINLFMMWGFLHRLARELDEVSFVSAHVTERH